VVGHGDYQYEVLHNWPQLPAQFRWQTTHNVAVDHAGQLYVIHEGDANQPDHPAIFVFDAAGKYVRSFGHQFQGGGHGIEVHTEGGQEYLYLCGYQQVKAIAKLDLRGAVVWQQHAPMESGKYAEGEADHPQKIWGRDRFMPTNTTFLPDGDFLVADGYGSYYVHRYSHDGKWKSCLGGPGEGKGKFDTPHGLWLDSRPGREPRLVVADRAHHTLQLLTLTGEYVDTLTGFGLPANIDTHGDLMVIAELFGRVSLLDGDNQVVAQLGDDSARIRSDTKFAIRGDETQWQPGRFVHPHDACFDATGNIYVAEWVATGRVTKLSRLG
jgi:hemin uptake protein HemP